MKKVTKIALAFVLCLCMGLFAFTFAGCTKNDSEILKETNQMALSAELAQGIYSNAYYNSMNQNRIKKVLDYPNMMSIDPCLRVNEERTMIKDEKNSQSYSIINNELEEWVVCLQNKHYKLTKNGTNRTYVENAGVVFNFSDWINTFNKDNVDIESNTIAGLIKGDTTYIYLTKIRQDKPEEERTYNVAKYNITITIKDNLIQNIEMLAEFYGLNNSTTPYLFSEKYSYNNAVADVEFPTSLVGFTKDTSGE